MNYIVASERPKRAIKSRGNYPHVCIGTTYSATLFFFSLYVAPEGIDYTLNEAMNDFFMPHSIASRFESQAHNNNNK